jgi:2-keto-4-pentenoate hydratase
MASLAGTADALAVARRQMQRLPEFPGPPPATLADAYDLQLQVQLALGGEQVGWKIGCTSETARRMLGADAPFGGPLPDFRIFQSGDTVPTGADAVRGVEPELALRLGRPRAAPYTVDEMLAAIDAVHPAIEIVNRRVTGAMGGPLFCVIADGAANDALVLGEPRRLGEIADLAAVAVQAFVNDVPRTGGHSSAALGGPAQALTWLVNDLSRRGIAMPAGYVVATGLLTEFIVGQPGERIEAVFEGVGRVTVQL